MRVRPRILANASDLPRDPHSGSAAADLELIVGQFFGDVDGSKTADASELVAENRGSTAEPLWHLN